MQVRKECPKMNVAIYTYGKRMLESFIKDSKSKIADGEDDAKKYQNDLLQLYDEWLINFPTYKGRTIIGEIISNKAQVMVDYKLASNLEIYNVFNKAYSEDRASFDDQNLCTITSKFIFNCIKMEKLLWKIFLINMRKYPKDLKRLSMVIQNN